jgi:hypothetical protein
LAFGVDYSVGSNFFKNMAHRPPFFSNPVLRVFSKYILAVMADKSDEEIQIMEDFTSTSDTDNMTILVIRVIACARSHVREKALQKL